MSESQHICARCAGLGPTCCQRTQVFVTRGDVARISRAIGDETFSEISAPMEDGYSPDFEGDPVWGRIFDADGRRRILAHQPDHASCHFLTPAGCRLAEETRPLVCRLYPFDYNAAAIKGVFGHLCPQPEAQNAPLLLAQLGMNRDKAEEWRKTLYREIQDEFPA